MNAIITIHPYHRPGWKGWAVKVEDSLTGEAWHRPSYYKADATQLKQTLEKQGSLDDILNYYGEKYFERTN